MILATVARRLAEMAPFNVNVNMILATALAAPAIAALVPTKAAATTFNAPSSAAPAAANLATDAAAALTDGARVCVCECVRRAVHPQRSAPPTLYHHRTCV
jgi:hypothetical protein